MAWWKHGPRHEVIKRQLLKEKRLAGNNESSPRFYVNLSILQNKCWDFVVNFYFCSPENNAYYEQIKRQCYPLIILVICFTIAYPTDIMLSQVIVV